VAGIETGVVILLIAWADCAFVVVVSVVTDDDAVFLELLVLVTKVCVPVSAEVGVDVAYMRLETHLIAVYADTFIP
jgi:hypothetical protein